MKSNITDSEISNIVVNLIDRLMDNTNELEDYYIEKIFIKLQHKKENINKNITIDLDEKIYIK